MKLPLRFEEKMRELLNGEFPDYIACYDEPRYYGLRVNTGKISVEEFKRICPFKIRPVPWISNGFYYDGDTTFPSRHPYYFAGLYYLQEPSAMTPASRLPVRPGERVLDLCAAPGGKATELGARLLRDGVLVANDLSSSRAKGLLKNIEVFGIGNVLVLSEEPGKLKQYFPEYFDKILIDAPCSGEGMFRKDRKMLKAWEEHGPEFFSPIQRNIILQAAELLRPGGMLLYSTCTFDARENEQVAEHLLRSFPEFSVVPVEGYEGFSEGRAELTESGEESVRDTVRIFPHKMHGEGHYVALFKKGGFRAEDKRTGSGAGRRKLPDELSEFLEDVSVSFDASRIDIRGERVFYMPEGLPDVRGIRFLRTGLLMGELKKRRFEPSQALAMFLKKDEYKKVIDLKSEDERILKYLKGETIDTEDISGKKDKGWYLVCVDSYPLGWGKLSGGVLKNKYLPGWRLC